MTSATAGAIAQRKPWDLLLLSAAALILISVARLHSFFPGLAAIRPGLIVTIVALAALFAGHKGPRKIKHLRSPLGNVMAFFIAWAVVGAVVGIYPGNSVRFLLDQFLREAIVIITIAAAVRNMEDLKRLVAVFGMGVLAFAFLAQGTGDRGVGGGGYDANDSAMFIVSGMPLIFYFMTRARRVWARILFGLGLLTCSSAVVLSGSRGGFIALVVTLVYSLFFLKGVNKVTRLVVVAAAIVIVVTQADGEYWDRMQSITAEDDYNRTSYTGRVEVWKRGIGYMVQNPIAGVGIDNFSVAEGWNPQTLALLQQGIGVKFSVAHSIWIQVAAEMGIPGVLALAAMFVQAIRGLWTAGGPTVGRKRLRGNQALDELNDLGRPLIGVLLAVAVAGSFLSRAYSSILWLPLALSLALIKVDVFTRRDQAEHSAAGRPVRRRPVITTPFGAPLPARSRGGYLPASRRPHVT